MENVSLFQIIHHNALVLGAIQKNGFNIAILNLDLSYEALLLELSDVLDSTRRICLLVKTDHDLYLKSTISTDSNV